MNTTAPAKAKALMATCTSADLMDTIESIERDHMAPHELVPSDPYYRVARLWIVDELEKRHPDAVDYIENLFMDPKYDDDERRYSAWMREALTAVNAI